MSSVLTSGREQAENAMGISGDDVFGVNPDAAAQIARAFVSIVMPCRNERAFIVDCLNTVLATTWPHDRLEILVVDGMSDDGTRELLADFSAENPTVRMLDNSQRITPVALNTGIRAARGDVVVRMDAHNFYPPEYVSKLVEALFRSGADNVGGLWITKPGNRSKPALAIALALASPFGVGNAHYRLGPGRLRWVDTVPFGCYRRSVFERVGLFDEELVRNQDDEFNLRLIRAGGRILLVSEVYSEYHARESLRKLWRMYYQYGLFKPLVIRKVRAVLTIRQIVPATFVLALIVGAVAAPFSPIIAVLFGCMLVAYILVDILASVRSGQGQPAGIIARMLVVFPIIHLAYGVGFLRGVFRYALNGRGTSAPDGGISLSR